MKITKSRDGIDRYTVRLTLRLTRAELDAVKADADSPDWRAYLASEFNEMVVFGIMERADNS